MKNAEEIKDATPVVAVGLAVDELNYCKYLLDKKCVRRWYPSVQTTKIILFSSKKYSSISSDTFRGYCFLERLDLYDNRLTHLDAFVFIDLNYLRVLDLHGNRIRNISNYTFNCLVNLKVLRLDNNRKLNKIDPHGLNGLSSLKYLHLERNRLVNFDTATFNILTQLEHLHLNNRRIATRRIARVVVGLESFSQFGSVHIYKIWASFKSYR